VPHSAERFHRRPRSGERPGAVLDSARRRGRDRRCRAAAAVMRVPLGRRARPDRAGRTGGIGRPGGAVSDWKTIMLSREENELICGVEGDAPAAQTLRRYWL